MNTIGITELATEEVYVGRCILPGKDLKDFTPDITAMVMDGAFTCDHNAPQSQGS